MAAPLCAYTTNAGVVPHSRYRCAWTCSHQRCEGLAPLLAISRRRRFLLRAKLYAIGAAALLGLLAFLKIVILQRDAAVEDARRAKKHMKESKDISAAKKEIRKETKAIEKQAVQDIKDGKMPDNIRNRNDF